MTDRDSAAGLEIARRLREDVARTNRARSSRVAAAVMAHLNGRQVEAARGYLASYDGTTDTTLALYGAALLAYQLNALERALRLLCVVTERSPRFAPAWYNAGLCWQLLGNSREALLAQRKALKLDPALVEAYNQLGIAYLDLGKHRKALRAFDQSIARRGKGSEARFNRAVSLILMGHFEEGWREYEARHEVMFLPKPLIPPHVPRWDGSPRHGTPLLLWCEQGLGDTLQMVRWAPVLVADGPVTCIVPKALQRLLQHAMPTVTFVSSGEDFPACELHASFMSLPWLTKATPATIPAPPYLFPATEEDAA